MVCQIRWLSFLFFSYFSFKMLRLKASSIYLIAQYVCEWAFNALAIIHIFNFNSLVVCIYSSCHNFSAAHYHHRRRRDRWTRERWCLVVLVDPWFSKVFRLRSFNLYVRVFRFRLLACSIGRFVKFLVFTLFITHRTDDYEKCEFEPSLLLLCILIAIFLGWVDVSLSLWLLFLCLVTVLKHSPRIQITHAAFVDRLHS